MTAIYISYEFHMFYTEAECIHVQLYS